MPTRLNATHRDRSPHDLEVDRWREVPVLLAAALHLLILLDPVEDLPQAAWVVGARNGSFFGPIHPGSRAPLFFFTDYCPPERTGKYPSQGTPLGSSWNLDFLNLT